MRMLAAVGAVSVLVLASSPDLPAQSRKPSRPRTNGHLQLARTPLQRISARLLKAAAPQGRTAATVALSPLELGIVERINALRTSRGLRALRVSRGLTAAARYHSRQMGTLGFFEHESSNGAPFWQRIERFYPAGRGYWSVGENIYWESPDTSLSSVMHEWMHSSPHRRNVLMREWREIGVAAVHFDEARGAFGGRPVTIVTTDFGVRR